MGPAIDEGGLMAPEEGYDPPSTVVNSHPSLPFDYSGIKTGRNAASETLPFELIIAQGNDWSRTNDNR